MRACEPRVCRPGGAVPNTGELDRHFPPQEVATGVDVEVVGVLERRVKVAEAFALVERDEVSRRNTPVPTTELRGKGLYDLSNSENMNNQNN